jgi:hypothetical protein
MSLGIEFSTKNNNDHKKQKKLKKKTRYHNFDFILTFIFTNFLNTKKFQF